MVSTITDYHMITTIRKEYNPLDAHNATKELMESDHILNVKEYDDRYQLKIRLVHIVRDHEETVDPSHVIDLVESIMIKHNLD